MPGRIRFYCYRNTSILESQAGHLICTCGTFSSQRPQTTGRQMVPSTPSPLTHTRGQVYPRGQSSDLDSSCPFGYSASFATHPQALLGFLPTLEGVLRTSPWLGTSAGTERDPAGWGGKAGLGVAGWSAEPLPPGRAPLAGLPPGVLRTTPLSHGTVHH